MWGNSHSKEFPHMTRGVMVGYCNSYMYSCTYRTILGHLEIQNFTQDFTSSVEKISPVSMPNKLNVFQHTYVHVRRVHM